jgi:hypothetical protein
MNRGSGGILTAVIVLLALADGLLHLSLDFVLFGGNFFGTPSFGPPPGGRPGGPGPYGPPRGRPPGGPGGSGGPAPLPFPLPLNQLFFLNFLGYMVLVIAFLLAPRFLGARAWIVDIVFALYAAATIVGWFLAGAPNPMGLGVISKVLEVTLIVVLLIHAWMGFRKSATAQPSQT